MDKSFLRRNAGFLDAWLRYLEALMVSRSPGETYAPAVDDQDEEERAALDEAVRRAEFRVTEATRAMRDEGYEPPLLELARRFSLEPVEAKILALAMAPALDSSIKVRIGRFYRNVLLNYVSVDLCLRLFFDTREERLMARRTFLPGSRLRSSGLILVQPAQDMPSRLLTDHEVTVPEELVTYVLGQGAIPETGPDLAASPGESLPTQDPFEEIVAAESAKERWRSALTELRRILDEGQEPPVILLSGPFGSGRRLLATLFARALGRSVRKVRLDALHLKPEGWGPFVEGVLRDCLVDDQIPLFTDLQALSSEAPDDRDRAFARQTLLELVEAHQGLVMISTEEDVPALSLERPVWPFPLPTPTMEERELLWRRFLGPEFREELADAVRDIADQYPLTGGLIKRSAEGAVAVAAARGRSAHVCAEDLKAGIRSQLAHRLRSVAELIEPGGRWTDVVVKPETEERLKEMVAYFRHRRKVWEQWGFGSKFTTLRGVSALFYGPPGTGKSFTASVVAAELGMDLFRVDLSQVVSKWIGETEKNLGRVFDEAERGHVVLFFDEADSLFTKRTEVSSSVDRYANLEVNYLLQRMERYEGVTILATNHESSLDPAFKRRLQFRIHFPLPEQQERLRLWKALIPDQAEIADDVDWDYLAEAFEMSGGHIRNAIVRAAFRAAELDCPIDGELLAWAATVEYEEMGRLIRR